MKKIFAKFNSRCAETGTAIKKGEEMLYDYRGKKCYAKSSPTFINYNNAPGSSDAAMVKAQEEEYYDSWYRNTYLIN